jgi:raffinose/stachyose/melibiose transport system substrate-binding protein
MRWSRRIAALLFVVGLLAAACSNDDGGTGETGGASEETGATGGTGETSQASEEPVTIEWWHIQNNDPGLSIWQDAADAYMAEHPNVTVEITVLENEAFKAKITTNMQAGDPPDLFQSWGGGGLLEQVNAGLVTDVTDEVAPWISEINAGAASMYQVDGRQYGIPFDLGLVGIWYNKDLFAEAGIDTPPATWDELLAAVDALKGAGITPIAVGEGDKWPGMFWWAYLSVRMCGADVMQQAASDASAFENSCFVQAGEKLKELIDKEPFQDAFLATPWEGATGEAALVANGRAAMDLMGQWAPGTMQANAENGEGLGEALGWFSFPAVPDGAGDPTDGFGGGNGFAVGANAPLPETVDFLHYLVSTEVATEFGSSATGILPVTVGTESSVTDPNLTALLEGRAQAQYVQLYLDQAFPPAVGLELNDVIQTLYAGESTPEEVAQAIADAAASG